MFKFVQLNIIRIDKKRDWKEKKEKKGEKRANREKDRKDIIGGREKEEGVKMMKYNDRP